MITISSNKAEYIHALERHISSSARIMKLEPSASATKDALLFQHIYESEDKETAVEIHQYINIEDLPYKIIPACDNTGAERFNIDPRDWHRDDNGLEYATKIIYFEPSANGARDGNIIRLIKSDNIPKGMTHITIYNNIVEFEADPAILDTTQPVDILLTRFAFIHRMEGLYEIKGLNINELIGRAKNNTI